MIRPSLAVAFAVMLSSVHSHYVFVRLSVNGKWHAPLQYIRNHTHGYWEESTPGGYSNRPRDYTWWIAPSDRPESMRCGRDNMAWANQTEILSVNAGDRFEFASTTMDPYLWTDAQFNNCPDGRGMCNDPEEYTYFHPGPVVAHISKVPDGQSAQTYDGTGEWTKIYTLGLEFRKNNGKPVHWLPRGSPDEYIIGTIPGRIIFNLPKETPKGQYLLRVASVWHASKWTYEGVTSRSEGQLFHSCAHIQVESDTDGALPKGVLIPEIFQYDQPGMVVSGEMGGSLVVDEDYTYPGGQLWNGRELVDDKPSL